MKRIKLLIILLVLSLLVTGCVHINLTNKKNSSKGRIYNIVSLQDKGINMFNTLIPEDWKASISSEDLINSSHPFVEKVLITNKDESAKIYIVSQHSYVENAKYNEGVNQDYYTTYLHYMDSPTYSDFFMNSMYKGSTFVETKQIDKELLEQVDALQSIRVENAKNDAQLLQNSTSGITFQINNVGATTSKRIYQNGETYYEMTTAVFAVSSKLTSSLSSLLDSTATNWYMPYVIVYEANSKENYDKYYDDYNFIIQNSDFTMDYYYMIDYVSSAIANVVTATYAAKSKAALDAMNNYIDSNYTSTSAQSTNDKVMEMWDDVIKEVDSYKTEDGSYIKTSIHNDTVAQNGDEIYIGSKAGIPIGFNELEKTYN